MKRTRRSRTASLVAAAVVLGGCAGGSTEAVPVPTVENGPLPTIGFDTEIGVLSGDIEVRQIDTGDVDSVVMIGDSITVGAQPMLQTKLEALGFDDVNVVAQQNKRTAQTFGDNSSGADIAAFVTDTDDRGAERLWVVALGTNDIGQYNSTDEVVAVVDEVLEHVPDGAPLVWINTYFEDRPEDTAAVNAAIDQAVGARPNSTVGRWDAIAPNDGVLRSDGVHPSDAGAEVFASFVTTTVSNYLQR